MMMMMMMMMRQMRVLRHGGTHWLAADGTLNFAR